jgi:uncharacterized protein YdeI (YjbR/CyaY-like superfamily)
MTSPRVTYPELLVESQAALREWFEQNWDTSPGILLVFYKKSSGKQGLTYEQAVEEALCFGWIDTTTRTRDAESYTQQYNPRKPKGTWTVLNKEKCEALIKSGRMREGGFKAIEAAKQTGSWDNPVTSPTQTQIPEDFEKRLKANPKAHTFYSTLSKTQQFYFIYWITSAKRPETREKRIVESLRLLEEGKKRGQ